MNVNILVTTLTKILSIILITLSILLIGNNSSAHSGRTDASGGHRDNKNKSGLGSYHYHCGDYLAHLHTNGICSYSSNSFNKSSISSSSSSSTTTTKTDTIEVTAIQINEKIEKIEVGKSKTLTATITPRNATNKKITWESNDEDIATINATGKVTAKKQGTVEITATSSNGKTSVIRINIEEKPEVESNHINSTLTLEKNDVSNNEMTSNDEDPNTFIGIIGLGLLGGGAYLIYKNYKKGK